MQCGLMSDEIVEGAEQALLTSKEKEIKNMYATRGVRQVLTGKQQWMAQITNVVMKNVSVHGKSHTTAVSAKSRSHARIN